MLYSELYDADTYLDKGVPLEFLELEDWRFMKGSILGEFPESLKESRRLMEWLLHSSHIVHPVAVVSSFITIVGGLGARKIYTETDASTTLYNVAIAPTGSGKDIITQAPQKIFNKYQIPNTAFVQSKITSEGALDDIFKENDVVIHVVDEFGDQLGQMLSDSGGHLKALTYKYKTLYSSTNGIYASIRYSSTGGKSSPATPWTKEKPCFSLTGATTRTQLLSRLKESMIHDGFLNRFIIMDGSNMEPYQTGHTVKKELPHEIELHINSFITHFLIPPNETKIPMSHDAGEFYYKSIGSAYNKDSDIFDFCKADESEVAREISARWRENSIRLATAITAYEMQYTVTLETLKWCYNFIKKMSVDFVDTFQNEVSKTQYQIKKDKAISWFKMKKGKTYSLSDLAQSARPFKNLTSNERKTLLTDLQEVEIIELVQVDKKNVYRLKP